MEETYMKKWLALVLSLVLMFSALSFAAAEGTNEQRLTARDIMMSRATGNLALLNENSQYYQMITPDGQVLVGEDQGYTSMYFRDGGLYCKVEVASEDGIHDEGLLDRNGNVLVPAEYADVNVISSRWQAGIKLTPCEADDKDYTFTNYSTGDKSFFRIDYADMYFDGQKVGSLSRAEYGGGNMTAYNTYLSVMNISRERVYYNSKLEKSPVEGQSGEYTSTYSRQKTTYIHNGSGQEAFVPSCTLKPEDVVQAYVYDDYNDVFLDLQGNPVFKTARHYDSVRTFYNQYARVYLNRRYGVIDLQGNEVVPLEYDSISSYDENLMAFGFTGAQKEGKFGFVDINGNVTCPFVYSADIVSERGTFATVKNLDGTIIVLTAGAGELQEHFADVSFAGSYGSYCFVGQNSEGKFCVIDLYGNTVLPYTEARSIDVNRDGTVALVYYGSRQYSIVKLEKPEPAAAPSAEEAPAEAPEANAEAAPAQDGSWTCENGHAGNTGKFCTECGAAKPVVEEKITKCPNCGYEFGEETPKFCPECGTKIQ